MYVRFDALKKNSRGIAPGVFALANGLAHSGALSNEDYAWWRANNDWMNGAYSDPATGNYRVRLFLGSSLQAWRCGIQKTGASTGI